MYATTARSLRRGSAPSGSREARRGAETYLISPNDHLRVVEVVRDLPISQKIRGMTEKYVLREAARPVLSATVYARQKHPFLAPPAALAPGERLHELVQETLRGPVMASLPFYDRAKVVAMLDDLPALGDDARTALDPVLMILLSACCLQQRYFQ
jgi:asparagine synthase (glutamine-hydrolysing)